MDLETAVAASVLPASRIKVAAAFRELSQEGGTGLAFLELLASVCGTGEGLMPADLHAALEAAGRALADAGRLGIEPLALFDPRYPPLLAATRDPPPVLWVRGSLSALDLETVAVIGSRAATPYALQVGERLAAELAERGMVVASGLARGVDSAAHRGCLDAGGTTVAVLGCGLDRVYPPEHGELASRIAGSGAIVSELAPGTPPLPGHFPLRNRVISGISLATVVVEASERSGSLITARYALEQGRDVMAVPGSVLSGRNRGSHALLKDGAKVVETAADVLEGLGWPSAALVADPAADDPDELMALMAPAESYTLEELAKLSGLTSPTLLARLTRHELAGKVETIAGRFVRTSPRGRRAGRE